jgi:serine kinase of HPr protein (carbohydrate metabolism regulator)
MPPLPAPRRQVHGTAVALAGRGVLLRGRPGAGKSDLALRLIDRGARLVADDRVDVSVRRGRAIAAAPRVLAGLIEARGVGVVSVPRRARAEIVLVVDLTGRERVERMPEAGRCVLAGVRLPRIRLAPFEASAPIKIRLALAQITRRRKRKRAP